MCLVVIASRKHYTVYVFIAIYVTPSIFYATFWWFQDPSVQINIKSPDTTTGNNYSYHKLLATGDFLSVEEGSASASASRSDLQLIGEAGDNTQISVVYGPSGGGGGAGIGIGTSLSDREFVVTEV